MEKTIINKQGGKYVIQEYEYAQGLPKFWRSLDDGS
jgi:hypothetical protein